MYRLYVIFILIGVTVALSVATGAEQNKGPAELVVPGGRFGDVPFPHRTHQETLNDCNTCHHLFPQQTGSIVQLKKTGKLQSRQVMNECTECHLDRKQKGLKTGPTSCGGCHSG